MAGYWLMKSEPEVYSWDNLVADKRTPWDGVRNYQARNNIRAMRPGHLALFYHSGAERRVAGVMRVVSEPYPDPAADDPQWLVVDVAPQYTLKHPVTLADIKMESTLMEIALVKQSRLSVMPLDKKAFERIVAMGGR